MDVTVLKKKEIAKKTPVVTTRTNERQVLAKIQMTRAKNLALLVEAAGGVAEFADIVDTNPQNIQNYIETKLSIGDEFAAHIEFSLDLPARWLDRSHEEENVVQELRTIIEKAKKLKDAIDSEGEFGGEGGSQMNETTVKPTENRKEQSKEASQEALDTDLPLDELVDHYRSIALRKIDDESRKQFAELGKVLSELLSGKGAKQKLAKTIDVHPSAVSLMLKGTRPVTPEQAIDIAEFLRTEYGADAEQRFVAAYKEFVLPIYEARRRHISKAFVDHVSAAASDSDTEAQAGESKKTRKSIDGSDLTELSKAFAEAFAAGFAKFLDDYVAKKR